MKTPLLCLASLAAWLSAGVTVARTEVQGAAQTIINDMTLPGDAALHGVPPHFSWASGHAYLDNNAEVPHKNWKGEWFQACTLWGQVYIPVQGSPATNTRTQIRNLVTRLLLKDGTWVTVQTSAKPQGGAFREDFANNTSIDAGERDETTNGGGISVKVGVAPWTGYNYHFWPYGSRASVDVTQVIGVFTSCEARLIVDNPNLPDDRARCKNTLQCGADWWLSLQGGWLPDWSANSGIGSSRAKWVTSEWQTFNMCTETTAALLANPPVGPPPASVAVTGVSLSPPVLNILPGVPTMLIATLAPTHATNPTTTWQSSNPAIATVSATGSVTGLTGGTAIITVTTEDGLKTASSTINVSLVTFSWVNVGNAADGITKNGGWDNVRAGSINNDEHFMSNNTAYCHYTFTGSGVEVIGFKPGGAQYGANYTITVDDMAVATGNTTSATDQFQVVLGSKTDLSAGSHTVKIAFTSGIGAQAFVIVDAFKIHHAATPVPPLQAWRTDNGLPADGSGLGADTCDTSGNGIPNLLKYALGMRANATTQTGLPVIGTSAGNRLTLTFPCDTSLTDINSTVEATSDLTGPWTPIARSVAGATTTNLNNGAFNITDTGTDIRSVTVEDNMPLSSTSKRFLRLKVSR